LTGSTVKFADHLYVVLLPGKPVMPHKEM